MQLSDEIHEYLDKTLDKVREYRGGLIACCPFHNEKSPSMFIYYDEKYKYQWWWKCHGCELTGSLNTLLRRLKGHHLVTIEVEFLRTARFEGATRTQLFDDTTGYPAAYTYYRQRGISNRISKYFGFRFDFGAPAAIMPVYTEDEYLGCVRRQLDPSLPRYHLSAGMDLGKVLWGMDAINYRKATFITEGIIDAACLWSQGLQAVSLVVKGSYEYKLELLSKLKKPILIPDNDMSGLKTFEGLSKKLAAPMVFVPPKYKDVNDWVLSGTFKP